MPFCDCKLAPSSEHLTLDMRNKGGVARGVVRSIVMCSTVSTVCSVILSVCTNLQMNM